MHLGDQSRVGGCDGNQLHLASSLHSCHTVKTNTEIRNKYKHIASRCFFNSSKQVLLQLNLKKIHKQTTMVAVKVMMCCTSLQVRHGRTCSMRATIPAARGAAADVPVWPSVQPFPRCIDQSDVTCRDTQTFRLMYST